MMSENPRGQVDLGVPKIPVVSDGMAAGKNRNSPAADSGGEEFVEQNHRFVMEAEHASQFLAGKDAHWQRIIGLGYNGEAVTVFPATAAVRATPEKILAGSPCLEFTIAIQTPGDWRVTGRALPTFSVETGQPQRYAIAFDDAPPQIIPLPASQDERNRQWQENVLRNAALTTSVHAIARPGKHLLKIWMVDPGVVLDTIIGDGGDSVELGYTWPAETRCVQPQK